MTATGKSVLRHPAKDEITERLCAGESVEQVAAWLKIKYGKQPDNWLNKMTLQAYRKNFLEIDGKILEDLKKQRRAKIEEEKKKRAVEAVHASDAYQVALAHGAEVSVRQIEDTGSRLEELFIKINERITVMESLKISHLNDKVIAEYIRLLKDLMKDWFEMQQKLKDEQQTTVDIDVRKIMTELKVIKTALREAISEVCPEVMSVFMVKLKEKLESARLMADATSDELEETPININIRA